MSLKLKQIWVLTVFCSLGFLFLSPPLHAQPPHRPLADAWSHLAALGDSVLARIDDFVLGIWHQGGDKEGTSIDPNASPNPQGPQSGAPTDEGVTIDPNGHP